VPTSFICVLIINTKWIFVQKVAYVLVIALPIVVTNVLMFLLVKCMSLIMSSLMNMFFLTKLLH